MGQEVDQAPATRAAVAELARGRDLDSASVTAVFHEMMADRCHPAQIGALLLGLAQKGETLAEIVGAAIAMREAATQVCPVRRPLLDTCGTGGSGVPRLNVSTAVAIAVAACGVAVAKHGNRAASSRSGSADVLEALGVRVDAPPSVVARCIDEVGLGFLFAPGLHRATRYAMPARKALGVRTLFNLLGPLTHPAGATRQLVGVFDPRRCELLAAALGTLGADRAVVVHGFARGIAASASADPGIDDLSTEGETLAVQWHHGRIARFVLSPEQADLPRVPTAELLGAGPQHNAEALLRLLEGDPSAYRTAVQWSGAVALLAAGDGDIGELPAHAARIGRVLDDGSARSILAELVAASHAADG